MRQKRIEGKQSLGLSRQISDIGYRASGVAVVLLTLLTFSSPSLAQKVKPKDQPVAKPAVQAEARPTVPGGMRFSAVPDEFVTQVTNMMRLTRIPSCTTAADQFAGTWSSLSGAQQEEIIKTVASFSEKKYRPKPYYEAMMLFIVQAQTSLSSDQANLSRALECLRKISAGEAGAAMIAYCEQSRAFLVNKTLHFSRFYNLYSNAEQFRFEYVDLSEAIPDTIPTAIVEPPSTQKFDEWGSPAAELAAPPVSSAADEMRAAALTGPDVMLPPLEGALIRFEKTDLTFGTGFDSTTLSGTKGAYSFRTGHFIGEGGRFDWSVAGLEPAKAFVKLGKYAFPVKQAALSAENVTLTYPERLEAPVQGVFEFRSVKHKSPETSHYPRFMTYGPVASLKGLGDEVTLRGGFALEGHRISTACVNPVNSVIQISHRGKNVFTGRARRFLVDSTITSAAVQSSLGNGSDSVTQAAARFVYERQPARKIKLYKDKGAFAEAPFFDSYHKVEIVSEALFYNLDSNKLDFSNLTNKFRLPVIIESQDYFTEDRYVDLQGINKFSPVGLLVANYSKYDRETHFRDYEVAERFKLNPKAVRNSMISLASQGFILFDPATGEGEMGAKLKHYFSSQRKQKDYDYINIQSMGPDKMNVRLDLDSNMLIIYGVDRFSVNDSLGVMIKPQDRTIKMLRNRDFRFNGEISAGNFVIHGEKFTFNYDQYQVTLPKIDSIKVVPDAKIKSLRERSKSSTQLTGKDYNAPADKPVLTNGVLQINRPDNKSNLKKLPQYPIFDVKSPAFVYFDKPNILKGAYDKRVVFSVPPFSVDSISGSNLSAIGFEGTFRSDDIVPDFKDRLSIRADKTLGFEHKVPAAGYQLYKGKGKFFGTLTMDGKGLRGRGEIRYLTTVLKSEDFIFYQDSVVARGPVAKMSRGIIDTVGYPEANLQEFALKWDTKKDTMYVSNVGKQPWYFFGKRVRLNGTLAVNEKGAFGYGLLKANGSRAESPAYTFKQDRITGRNAFFEVQSENPVKPSFACKNVRFDFFVEGKRAEFQPEEEGYASNEFPYARYKTSINRAVWDLEKKTIEMSMLKGADLTSSYFYSTLPEQDSLNFMASSAIYDLTKQQLRISGVPYILVADATLTPDSGKVMISEGAEMALLHKAILQVDTVNKYHRLVNGNITIKSRHVFEGDAIYQYVNAVNDTLPIKFDKFEFVADKENKDKNLLVAHTTSGGVIEEDKPLKIANGVLFKGGVRMFATKPSLEFEGFVKLDLRKTDTEWLRYSTTGESKEFALGLKEATDAEGQPLTTGLFIEDGSTALYGTFVNTRHTIADQEIFAATGTMNFNSETQQFRVGAADRLAGKTNLGPIFNYSDSTGHADFEGKFYFLRGLGKDLALQTVGTGEGQLDSSDYTFNVVQELELSLPSKAWAAMTKTIQARVKDIGMPEAMGDRSIFGERVAEMLGPKVAEDFKKANGSKYKPLHEVYPRFAKGLVFTDMTWKWHKKQSAFYTTSKLSLLNILGAGINAQLEGYIEIKKGEGGADLFNMYIEASPDAWYFFSLDDQKRMGTVSAQADYNEAISEKAKPRAGDYYFDIAEESDKNAFLKHFRRDYLRQKINEADYRETKKEEPAEPAADAAEETKPDGAAQDEYGNKTPAKKDKKKKKKGKTDEKPTGEPVAAEDTGTDDGFGGSEAKKKEDKTPASEAGDLAADSTEAEAESATTPDEPAQADAPPASEPAQAAPAEAKPTPEATTPAAADKKEDEPAQETSEPVADKKDSPPGTAASEDKPKEVAKDKKKDKQPKDASKPEDKKKEEETTGDGF